MAFDRLEQSLLLETDSLVRAIAINTFTAGSSLVMPEFTVHARARWDHSIFQQLNLIPKDSSNVLIHPLGAPGCGLRPLICMMTGSTHGSLNQI